MGFLKRMSEKDHGLSKVELTSLENMNPGELMAAIFAGAEEASLNQMFSLSVPQQGQQFPSTFDGFGEEVAKKCEAGHDKPGEPEPR